MKQWVFLLDEIHTIFTFKETVWQTDQVSVTDGVAGAQFLDDASCLHPYPI